MANDITKAISTNNIKNGSCLVGCKVTGFTSNDVLNTSVKNTPTINDIESKYDNRFDDISYYTIGSSTVVGG